MGEGQELRVIATHFHHPEDGGEARLLQTEELLSFWNAHPQTVVLGDLNANPDWPEMLGFWRAGFNDALEEVDPRATFPSDEPVKKIDYVLASPGLELSDPSVPQDNSLRPPPGSRNCRPQELTSTNAEASATGRAHCR